MRFLHTADWQIGMKAAHAGQAAEKVRAARLASAQTVIELARREAVDFILLAGDTFEDNGVSRRAVEDVASVAGSAHCPVYVIPGNHDPAGPGSVWEHPIWKHFEQVRVLVNRAPADVAGGRLFPCPVLERWSAEDPTAWIPNDGSATIRVGLAHGTVAGVPASEQAHPIARDAAERAGLDYIALGHFHSTSLLGRMAYSGTHEPSRFGERDSGQVLLVEIDEPGSQPRIRALTTGKLTWLIREETIRARAQLSRLAAELDAIPSPERVLLDCRLRGSLFADDRQALTRLRDLLAVRFLHGRLDTSELIPAPADDAWITELPEGYLRQAAAQLRGRGDELGRLALLALYEVL